MAKKLGVTSVLEGSVRKAGTRLRITAQLVNAADGCQLWSELYDRELVDVFALQDELTTSIANKFRLSMSQDAGVAFVRGALVSPAAYELLLKGRVLLWRRDQAIIESRVCLERSVALDPSYPEALGLLAECYRLQGHYGLAQL